MIEEEKITETESLKILAMSILDDPPTPVKKPPSPLSNRKRKIKLPQKIVIKFKGKQNWSH